MGITDKQKEARKKGLGASDMAAVLELATGAEPGSMSPYKTAASVFWDRRPDIIKEADPETLKEIQAESETAATRRGNILEGFIIDYARTDFDPHKLIANQLRVSKGRDGGIIRSNCDAIVVETGEPVECKTSEDFRRRDEWGAPETDEVPFGYLIQVHTQMLASEAQRGYIYAMLGWTKGLLPTRYVVDRNEKVVEGIINAALWFWHDHILAGVPPKGGEIPPKDILKSIPVTKGKVITLTDEQAKMVEAWEVHQSLKGMHEKGQDALTQELAFILKDAEIAKLPDGRVFTYKTQSRTMVDQSALKEQHPEIYKAVQKKTSFRVARTGKGD